MKREEQAITNQWVEYNLDVYKDYIDHIDYNILVNCQKRLRYCSAYVFDTPEYIILLSYSTVVAFIKKSSNEFFDVLRYVYGYTSTSSQHISKFRHDYFTGDMKIGYHTWREIK